MTHDELRKLAEAATPGPWYSFEGANSHCFDCRVGPAGDQNCAAFSDGYDATFIAAANPKTVLELLDRIAELEGAEKKGWNDAVTHAALLAQDAWKVPPDGGTPTEGEWNVAERAMISILGLAKQ